MLVLAIDTAGPDCAVALARGDASAATILAQSSERIGRGHAERLMPLIEATLAEAGVGFSDVDRIAVTTGPGSFTGVRIGVAAARGLALALDIPAVGVGSLQALAFPLLRKQRYATIAVAVDARRGEVYGFVENGKTGDVLDEPMAFTVAAFAERLRHYAAPLVLTGSAASVIAENVESDVEIAGAHESPDIDDVALLGLRANTAAPPTPLYARGADAKPQFDKALARL